jgi:hypothetical protein
VQRYECSHRPPCPPAEATDAAAARVVADCQEQGWSLLCNGLVSFDDLAAMRPDGTVCAAGGPPEPGPARRVGSRLQLLRQASVTSTVVPG